MTGQGESPPLPLPAAPMSPIASPRIPNGPDWVFQIKWDGVRTLARLDGNGGVELFSKRIELCTDRYPEISRLLEPVDTGPCVLDGEIVYFDGIKPNFQRGKLTARTKAKDRQLLYVMFDMLHDGKEDLRPLPFSERFHRLAAKFPRKDPRLFVTDIYTDGEALWNWVEERGWEGVVSKRIDSLYTEGKKHRDWYKRRKEIRLTADVVGIKLREGRLASLILSFEGRYIGHVSGLDAPSKAALETFMRQHPGVCPFPELASEMRKYDIAWLAVPFPCRVAALELTDSGLLRHPRLIGFGQEPASSP